MSHVGFVSPPHSHKKATESKDSDNMNQHTSFRNPLLHFNIPPLSNPFYGDIICGAQSTAYMNGCHLLASCEPITGINIDSAIHMVRYYKIAGLTVSDTIPELVLETTLEVTPVVQCNEFYPETTVSYKVSYMVIELTSTFVDVRSNIPKSISLFPP